MLDETPSLRLSWSRIREHEECKARGSLKAAGHRSPAADIRGYFHGNVVDLAMRRWLDQDDPQPGQMAAWVDGIIETAERKAASDGEGVVRWKGTDDKKNMTAWCKELCTKLERSLERIGVPRLCEYQPAIRFTVPMRVPHPQGGTRLISLVGEMDLLVRNRAGQWGVFDLKATRDKEYYRKVQGQLVFYEIAVRGWKGDWPVQSGLIQPHFDPPSDILPFEFSEEDRMQMVHRITSVAADLWLGDATPKVGSHCSICPVRHACPAHAAPASGRVTSWL